MTKKPPKELMPAPPLWSRAIGAVRSYFQNKKVLREQKRRNEEFKHVATISQETVWTDAGYSSFSYYILYENGLGERKYEYQSGNYLLKGDAKNTHAYARYIAPWMAGKYSSKQMAYLEDMQREEAK